MVSTFDDKWYSMKPILNPATFTFLDVIAEENTREFFAKVKPLYLEILESVTELCQYLIDETKTLDEDGNPISPKKCLFRIYCDARRIKPWGPLYKHHFSFFISPEGKKTMGSGYYLHIEPGNTFFASGIHRASAAYLYPLRKKFELYGDQYLKLTRKKKFKECFNRVWWNSLKRPPKGFNAETAHLDLVMKKQHLVVKKYTDEEVFLPWFVDTVLDDIAIVKEWSDWLREWVV